MKLSDFEVGDVVVVTPDCASTPEGDNYDFFAWSRTRMRVTGVGDVYVELIAIDSRPDREWILRTRADRGLAAPDPNDYDMFWLPEQLKKIS